MKELYIEAHEQLIEEYLEQHPNSTWEHAYDMLADKAYDRMRDRLADKADAIKQKMKDSGTWRS